jgi:hypothetical protein
MTLSQGDATNTNSGSTTSRRISTGSGSFSNNNKTPSTSSGLEQESSTAKERPTIENMPAAARTPSAASKNSTKNKSSDDYDDFLPEDESSPISLLSAASNSSCRDLDAFVGTSTTSTARKNLVSGVTGWGDLDSSDDDDCDDLL